MDSGNSGSIQSSSGGDDQEFDSRGETMSSFLNPSPHHFTSISAPPPPPFISHQNPYFFDSHLSQNLDHATQITNENDLIWSRGLRSTTQSIPTCPLPGPSSSDGQASRAPPPQMKNPKKRTRASRRAPTTVLKTDTTNFRQMVQEFTGIPAAPFSSSPYSRRLDLFSAASALRSGGHLDTLGPLYPLRPSAHKPLSPFPASPSLLNSTMVDAIAPPTTTIGNTSSNNIGASTSNDPSNFQLSTDQLLNIQHHHSIHQQPSLQLRANSPMNFGNLSGFLGRPETASGSGGVVQMRSNNDNLNRWGSGETVRNHDGLQENLVSFDGNINSGDSQNLSGYNLNLAEKGMENVGSSGVEGTTDASWICPSG